MIFRLLLFYIIVFTFFGCVSFVHKANLETFTDERTQLSTQYSKCNKIPGKIALMVANFELKYLSHSELTGKDNAYRREEFDAKILLREIERRDVIETNEETTPKYIFGFALHNDVKGHFLLPLLTWIPTFSLGIIPIKQNREMWVNVRVFDPSGKLIYEADSTKLEYDLYIGWLALLFWQKDKSMWFGSSFHEKFMPIMINDLINAMVKNNILDCKK